MKAKIISYKKKILFIVNVDWFFISHRLPIAIAAKEIGLEVHIATVFTKHKEELINYGFFLHSLDINRRSQNPISFIINILSLRSLLIKIKPNIVHLITIKPIILGSIALKFLRPIPVVASISGLGYVFTSVSRFSKIREFIIKKLYKYSFSNSQMTVIVQNLTDKEDVIKFTNLPKSKIILIPGSGVDLDIYYKLNKELSVPVVLFASRLLSSKGIYDFIEASNLVKTRSVFAIAGKIDLDHNDSISQFELDTWISQKKIEYWGFSSNMPDIINRSTIVVLPSFREGLPKILIEAASCGKAVITTNVPGCKDAIIDNVTGILIPKKDPVSLAKAIDKLLLDKDLCVRMGEKGRALAESKFNLNNIIQAHKDIYLNNV
tara:strand:- start:14347 stop:15480 length:1134 start_codon:yes stop_codon:yes gene_type:complete